VGEARATVCSNYAPLNGSAPQHQRAEPAFEGPVMRSQLTWWESTTIALALWVSALVGLLVVDRGAVLPRKRRSSKRAAGGSGFAY
jgi:hypothetical protein